MVVHFPEHINTYGSFVGFVVGFTIRLLGGEPYIHVPAVIHYPYFDYENNVQNFPFRTLSMLCSWVAIVAVSALCKTLFMKGIISSRFDFCECFYPKSSDLTVDHRRKISSTDCDSESKVSCSPREGESSINLVNCPAEHKLLKPESIKFATKV